ncbi:hypothetical protein H310_01669 [Aphanomyces invadans]|uniref:NTF2 domain-containing protein n=1 Tax=Aphanomyces invadans TaxID=157072 RepID=A0A024UTH8_9STRA|nr:hypothetical protein H310_01669 [Aphanomyces invadans]ETW09270.1 hypothetical protein H310_01669 [Aphanomyces invadans]|eukprot:XP_008863075.1 hypothetical protein H310_01669 [Aphanomyces invadans]
MTGPATASVPHPTTVGNTFVKQYYNLLTESPEKLHRFYKEESTFSHGHGSHPEESVSGQAAINSTILKKHYNGAVVQLDHGSIDCQGSQQGGVVVLVTGVITLQRSSPAHFVQSFFLAVQENGYFVLNDVLRILSIPSAKQQQPVSPKKAAPAPSPSKSTQTQAKEQAVTSPKHQATPAVVLSPPLPASNAPQVEITAHVLSPKHAANPTSPTKKPSTPKPSTPKPAAGSSVTAAAAVVHEEPKSVRPASPKKDEKHVVSPKNNKPKQTKPKSHDDERAAAPAPAADPSAPKSWASLFVGGDKKVSAVAAVASAVSAKVVSPRKKQQPTSSWDDEASAAVISPPPAPVSAPSQKPGRPVYFSLYIKQVPSPTTSHDLKELFKSYGKIAATNVNESKGHAFVDFYEEESMRSVLAAVADGVEFSIHGQILNVVERVSKDKASFTSGGRGGRGRGNGEGGYAAGGRGGRGGFNGRPKDGAASSGRPSGGRDGKPGGRGGRGGGYQGAAN